MNPICPQCEGRNIICGDCGYVFRPSDMQSLTDLERLVLDTLRDLRQSPFSPVKTRIIADVLGYTPRHVRIQLTNMKRYGVINTPHGLHSGWVETYAIEARRHIDRHVQTIQMAAA